MRLLRLQDDKLSLLKFDKEPPRYAILSHTWGKAEDEVEFEDLSQDKGKNKEGYNKIKFCAKQAADHNLEFFWIDTCCINKANVQEFQNAINSMYRWYQDAEVCFVYMADVVTENIDRTSQEPTWKECFRQSLWFTRSWTLQELLSPRVMEFYSREHHLLGTKESLEQELHTITGIPVSALRGADLFLYSIEQRISWAAGRESTFEEDQAYSLLGVCGVSMAPNYGEGVEEAFERLRETCDKKINKEKTALIRMPVEESDWDHGSRSHQVLTLKVSITELAEMFSTCLDALEQIDSHRDFDVDSRAISSQFDTDILLFKQWGKAVGFDSKTSGDDQYMKLNDVKTLSEMRKIFATIQDIAISFEKGSSSQHHGTDSTGSGNNPSDLQRMQLQKFRGVQSNKTKNEWTLGYKARLLVLSQKFGNLVERLRALISPGSSRSMGLAAGQTPRGILSFADTGSIFPPSAKDIDNTARHPDPQRIWIDLRNQIERNMRKELDTWLCASFTHTTYSDSIQKRLSDTCRWIMDRDEFRNWEASKPSSERAKVLWINGPAGYGKTILSASIIQHLKDQGFTTLGSYFFSADLKDRADPFIVIRSWISQLISQSRDAFDLACEKLETANGQSASSTEVMKLFKDIVQRVPHATFVVDGLDECSTTQSNTLASFIHMTIQAIAGTNSKVLVVSRKDQEIRKGFFESISTTTEIEIFEYEITPEDVKPDATKLSHSIVDQKLNKKSLALRADIAKRIVDRCDSMFLRIKLLENDIRGGKNQRQLERIVDQAPAELNSLYDRNWARIMRRGNDKDRALAILRWVAFGLRPITVFEMTEALLLSDLEDIEDLENELPDEIDEAYIETEILELCESLVEIRTDASVSAGDLGLSTLHLTHSTVRQYVLLHLPVQPGQLKANGELASSNESVQHNILAEACLRYMGMSSLWQSEHSKEEPSELRGRFRSYVMDSWNKHAKNDGCNYSVVSKLIISFFCSSSDSWESWRIHFDTTQVQSRMIQYQGDITSASKLFYAAILGLKDVLEALINQVGLDVNHVDESGRTALLAAAYNGELDLVAFIVQRNADINKASSEGRTPLYVASHNGHVNVVKLLLEKGADLTITNSYGWTPLNCASDSGHIEVVRLLLENGADWTIANDDGWTPFYAASNSGHVEIAALLLEKGADWTIANNGGWTPLNAASDSGHIDIIKLLLEKGADWTLASQNGWTPLNSASDCGHIEVVRLLLEKGADLTVANNDGWTPLYAASVGGHIEVVTLLLEKGADWTIVNNAGWTPLNAASDNGHIEVVTLLLEKGADWAVATKNGWTPLNCASDSGHAKVVKLLLKYGADWTVANNDGWTPLHSAASKGHVEVVTLLLEKGADWKSASNDGWTPLYAASDGGHVEVVSLLLEKGADCRIAIGGWTPLNIAAYKGHFEMVKLLLEKGADCAVANNDGWAPLHTAAYKGHIEVVRLLLDKGADWTVTTKGGWTPLYAASDGGHIEVVTLLLEKGADWTVANNGGWTPLNAASDSGHIKVVTLLLEKGADWRVATEGGWTPLNCASDSGHVEVVRLLLNKGANWTVANNDGWTPLYAASASGHVEVVTLLLEKGAEWTVPSNTGWTPLSAASDNGHAKVVKLLLDKGADWATTSKNGWTPLSSAAFKGNTEVVRLLLEKGADWKVTNADGWTPLYAASNNGHTEVVTLLLDKGADWTITSKDGWTPLNIASSRGHTAIVRLLLEKGASWEIANKYGWTPINTASANGCVDIVELLLEKGADWTIPSKNGWTPLTIASSKGHVKVVKALLDVEACNVNAPDVNGLTALAWAAKKGHVDIVDLLIEKGADTSIPHQHGATCINVAAREGHLDVVKKLLDYGCKWNVSDTSGSDALQLAILGGHSHIETFLLSIGGAILDDVYGMSALFEEQMRLSSSGPL